MIKIILLLVCSVISMVHAQSQPIIAPQPQAKIEGAKKKIILYGNSYLHYNNHINTRLRDLSRSLLPDQAKEYQFRGVTISSGLLGWHIPSLTLQNSLEKWDVVILQGNSMEPISTKHETRQFFVDSAKTMANIAQQSGSKVVYFMTWANKDKPQQTDKLAKAYIDIASKTGGYVAPVGLAFRRAHQTNPEINLYHSDGQHPSLAGSYLAACVLFATIFNQSPVGGALPIDSDMSEPTARALQQVAWDTVQQFRSQNQ